MAQMVKNPPAMQETQLLSLGREDPLAEGMATRSSVLAWRIPWTEESGGLQSLGLQRVGRDGAADTSGRAGGGGASPPARLSGASSPCRWCSHSPPGPQCLLPDPRANPRGVGAASETPGTQVWLGGCGSAVETRKERSLKSEHPGCIAEVFLVLHFFPQNQVNSNFCFALLPIFAFPFQPCPG